MERMAKVFRDLAGIVDDVKYAKSDFSLDEKSKGLWHNIQAKRKRGEDRRKTDRGNDRRFNKFGEPEQLKRARGKKGKYLADDLTTTYTNEAWVGGKAPKKRKKK